MFSVWSFVLEINLVLAIIKARDIESRNTVWCIQIQIVNSNKFQIDIFIRTEVFYNFHKVILQVRWIICITRSICFMRD